VLLAAVPRVADALPAARFVLAGDPGEGGIWAAFRRSCPDLALARVEAPGRVTDAELDRLYRRCSVFVAPSRYESFGLVYVEAMARSRPVIGCRAGGIPEVIAEGRTGLLADPGDPESLACSMIRLGSDPALRRAFGEAGRRDFAERFSAEAMARLSADLYRRVGKVPL
jgi:glycosyltransferase involved in cell wall biosynthesis